MWFNKIPFFHDMFHDLVTYMLFNTIDEYQDGITLYDLKKMGNIPHSKLYRMMKKQEEKKILIVKEERNDLGRPKHLYFFSEEGHKYHKELRKKLEHNITKIKMLYNSEDDFDANSFLDKINFSQWENPIERCLKHDGTNKDKLEHLRTLEEHTFNQLTQIREAIAHLQKDIKKQETGDIAKNE